MSNTVTVLIPTYRRPAKLKRAIESVLSQTHKKIKIVVCDNASGDETTNVVHEISKLDNRVFYFKHEINIGMNENFNFAISKVDTPFFTFLTDDDYYLKNYLQEALNGFERFPDVACSILSAPTILESGVVLSDQVMGWPKEGRYEIGEAITQIIDGAHPILTACVFKSEIKHSLNFEDRFGALSDIPLLTKLLVAYPVCLSKKTGLYFIRHSEAAGAHSIKIENILSAWKNIHESISNAGRIESATKRKFLQKLEKLLAKLYFRLMLRSICENDRNSFLAVFEDLKRVQFTLYIVPAFILRKLVNTNLGIYILSVLMKSLRSAKRKIHTHYLTQFKKNCN